MAAVLRHRDFRMLWLGQTISAAGDQVFTVAMAIRVLAPGGSAADLGLVLTGRAVALTLLLLGGGVLADRVPRAYVMLGADICRFFAVLCLAFIPSSTSVWVLVGFTFFIGAGEALFRPAYRAVFPTVLQADQLRAANALTSLSLRGGAVVGPALGGLLISLAGTSAAFTFDAITFLVSLVTLLAISRHSRASGTAGRRPRASFLREGLAGFQVMRTMPWIGTLTLMACLHLTLAVPPWQIMLPIVARHRLGGTYAYSLLLALFPLGAVIGALLSSRLRIRRPGVVSLVLLTFFGGVLLALALPAPLALLGVLHVVAGCGLEMFGVYLNTGIQRSVPPDMLARVMALDSLGSLALMPIGLSLAGWAITAVGGTPILLGAAGVMFATTLAPLAVPGVARLGSPARGAGQEGSDESRSAEIASAKEPAD